jgi:hypothetical protein
MRLFRTFSCGAEAFRKASELHEHDASESHE